MYKAKFSWKSSFVFVEDNGASETESKVTALLKDWDRLQIPWIELNMQDMLEIRNYFKERMDIDDG